MAFLKTTYYNDLSKPYKTLKPLRAVEIQHASKKETHLAHKKGTRAYRTLGGRRYGPAKIIRLIGHGGSTICSSSLPCWKPRLPHGAWA